MLEIQQIQRFSKWKYFIQNRTKPGNDDNILIIKELAWLTNHVIAVA
jgi:hypothetical protein